MKKKYKYRRIIFHIALFFSTIGLIGITGIVVTRFLLNDKLNSNYINTSDKIVTNWNQMPTSYKEFSTENSLKIQFQISNSNNGEFFVSNGTAWSWYFNKTGTNSFEWYFMTNFHVVNEAVAFQNNFSKVTTNEQGVSKVTITNEEGLLSYYSSNSSTVFNHVFSLEKYINNRYVPFINSQITSSLKRVEIITDFNNDSIDLFSFQNKYNLDMALVKLSLETTTSKIPSIYDPIQKYMNYDFIEKEQLIVNNSRSTYIAGHPVAKNALTPVVINDKDWYEKIEDLAGNGEILNKLKAPYYWSLNKYNNFPLTGGASGSAVYQPNQIGDDLNEIIPIGIYWGGKDFFDQNNFQPSFIPFIVEEQYNIFDNFIDYINHGI